MRDDKKGKMKLGKEIKQNSTIATDFGDDFIIYENELGAMQLNPTNCLAHQRKGLEN